MTDSVVTRTTEPNDRVVAEILGLMISFLIILFVADVCNAWNLFRPTRPAWLTPNGWRAINLIVLAAFLYWGSIVSFSVRRWNAQE